MGDRNRRQALLRIRQKAAIWLSLRLVPKSFSIISDDCWGGQIYRQLHLRYLTPTVGLWIQSADYLNYLENFDSIHREELKFIKHKKKYPLAHLSGVRIHFLHSTNEAEAAQKYLERHGRIDRENVFYKIDFGKTRYTQEDILRWNRMRLRNSVALYPPTLELPSEGIHNGVLVRDWVLNGEAMFDISRKHFNVFAWLRHGRIEHGVIYRMANAILFDPTAPERFASQREAARGGELPPAEP